MIKAGRLSPSLRVKAFDMKVMILQSRQIAVGDAEDPIIPIGRAADLQKLVEMLLGKLFPVQL